MVEYVWVPSKIEKKMKNLTGLRKITVSTAFLTLYGVGLLRDVVFRNKLKKQSVAVYLSKEFSDIDPGNILERLRDFADVYIVNRKKLHAKVYYFESDTDLLIVGSSNLTKGGMVDNLEFNIQTDEIQEERIRAFFERCRDLAVPVTDEIVRHYKDTEKQRRELRQIQRKLTATLDFEASGDPFDEEMYILDGYYFNFTDYETLFPKYQEVKGGDIDRRRKAIQDKLLVLDKRVSREFQKVGLVHHWMDAHITSVIRPMDFNDNCVSWIGVRYARAKTVSCIRELKLSGDGYGFPKYACIQFCLTDGGFEINLFHAVKNDAVDRDYLHSQIGDAAFASELIKAIDELKGYGLYWHIDGFEPFEFDSRPANEFIEFYKQDENGRTSSLSYWVEPDDIRLFDEESILEMVMEISLLLIPLLDLVSTNWDAKTLHN